jgi:hypothetical protein
MEIKSSSKLFDVLKEYPFLEERISNVAPPFKNLRNPVLRRTVGQLATIERVAQIGRLDVTQFVNTLRRAVGQLELKQAAPKPTAVPAHAVGDPVWTLGEPLHLVNGTELLNRGEVPVQHVNQLIDSSESEGFILLVTDFEPSPIIEAMRKQGRQVHHKLHPSETGQHLTYIRVVRG